MIKRLLTFGLAVFIATIGAAIFFHALNSQRPPPTRPVPVAEAPQIALGEPALSAEAPQVPPPGPPPPRSDPVGQNLFPPELIMQFQAQIGLSTEQRQAIMADLQQAQPKFERLQRQLQQEQAALGSLLEKDRVDVEPVLAQSDKLQELEREMRHTQLALMIGLKNRLTTEQQARLRQVQARPGRAGTSDQ